MYYLILKQISMLFANVIDHERHPKRASYLWQNLRENCCSIPSKRKIFRFISSMIYICSQIFLQLNNVDKTFYTLKTMFVAKLQCCGVNMEKLFLKRK